MKMWRVGFFEGWGAADTHPFQQALLRRAQSLLCDPILGNGAARSWSSIHRIPIELLLSAHTHARAHTHTHRHCGGEATSVYIVKAPLVQSVKERKAFSEQRHFSTTAFPPFSAFFSLFFLSPHREIKDLIRGNARARGKHTHTQSHTDICSLYTHLLSIYSLAEKSAACFSPLAPHLFLRAASDAEMKGCEHGLFCPSALSSCAVYIQFSLIQLLIRGPIRASAGALCCDLATRDSKLHPLSHSPFASLCLVTPLAQRHTIPPWLSPT